MPEQKLLTYDNMDDEQKKRYDELREAFVWCRESCDRYMKDGNIKCLDRYLMCNHTIYDITKEYMPPNSVTIIKAVWPRIRSDYSYPRKDIFYNSLNNDMIQMTGKCLPYYDNDNDTQNEKPQNLNNENVKLNLLIEYQLKLIELLTKENLDLKSIIDAKRYQ